jgi:hypothetical protein
MPLDGIGFVGIVLQYTMAILFSLMAALFLGYFYVQGLSSWDEDAKKEMMRDE